MTNLSWLQGDIETLPFPDRIFSIMLSRYMPLPANLAGFFKLRVGDYRVIYSFDEDLKVITIHQIGHRREIYD